MIWIDIIKCCLLITGSAVAAYSDLKIGKIRNKLILLMIISGVILDIISFIFCPSNEFIKFVVNIITILLLSIILYLFKIWAGGDSKLLIVIALLYPVSFYWKNNIYINLIILVGIIFSFGFLYIFIESIILFCKEKDKYAIKDISVNFIHMFIRYLITLIYISTLSHLYLNFFQSIIFIPQVLYCVICILFVYILHYLKIFFNKIMIFSFLFIDILMSILTKNITLNHFWPTYIVVLVFMLIRAFVNRYNYQEIATSEIKEGMVLSRASSILFHNSRFKGLPEISDETLGSRLTESQVNAIYRWGKSVNGRNNLVIVRKFPFAIFIFVGTVVYLAGGILT